MPDLRRNYGCGLIALYEAADHGCKQVLWLYGEEHKISEAGTMNIFLHWLNEDGGESHPASLLTWSRRSASVEVLQLLMQA